MAANINTESYSYYKQVSIDLRDGNLITFTVDEPTYDKVRKNDVQTINNLKDSYLKLQKSMGADETVFPTTSTSMADVSEESQDQGVVSKNKSTCAKVWTDKETVLLITIRIAKNNLFNQQKSHKTIWANIALEMQKHNYIISGDQCSNKWKSLKITYMEVVDHNAKSSNDKKEFKYFEQLLMNCMAIKYRQDLHSLQIHVLINLLVVVPM